MGATTRPVATPGASRGGSALSPTTLVGGAIVVLLAVVVALAIVNLTGGHQAAVANVTPSPSLHATSTPTLTPTPTGTPGTEFAGTACRLVSDLTAAHNDDVVPIVQLITAWTTAPSIPVGPEPRGRAAAWDAAAAQVVSRNSAVAGSLRSADHPQLVADIARAYSTYGSGLAVLAPAFNNSNTYDSLSAFQTGMQQLADGKASLDDAHSQLELLTAAGSANCP